MRTKYSSTYAIMAKKKAWKRVGGGGNKSGKEKNKKVENISDNNSSVKEGALEVYQPPSNTSNTTNQYVDNSGSCIGIGNVNVNENLSLDAGEFNGFKTTFLGVEFGDQLFTKIDDSKITWMFRENRMLGPLVFHASRMKQMSSSNLIKNFANAAVASRVGQGVADVATGVIPANMLDRDKYSITALGGGKSGAYLFVFTPILPTASFAKYTDNEKENLWESIKNAGSTPTDGWSSIFKLASNLSLTFTNFLKGINTAISDRFNFDSGSVKGKQVAVYMFLFHYKEFFYFPFSKLLNIQRPNFISEEYWKQWNERKNIKSVKIPKMEVPFIAKVYVDAFLRGVDGTLESYNDRPWRETFTLMSMNNRRGNVNIGTCRLLEYGRLAWKQIEYMFSTNPTEIENKTHGDIRGVKFLPDDVLVSIFSVANGEPLLTTTPEKHGDLLLGAVAELCAVYNDYCDTIPGFSHWDLHPDNIFIDFTTQMRDPINISQLKTIISNKVTIALSGFSRFTITFVKNIGMPPLFETFAAKFMTTQCDWLKQHAYSFLQTAFEKGNVPQTIQKFIEDQFTFFQDALYEEYGNDFETTIKTTAKTIQGEIQNLNQSKSQKRAKKQQSKKKNFNTSYNFAEINSGTVTGASLLYVAFNGIENKYTDLLLETSCAVFHINRQSTENQSSTETVDVLSDRTSDEVITKQKSRFTDIQMFVPYTQNVDGDIIWNNKSIGSYKLDSETDMYLITIPYKYLDPFEQNDQDINFTLFRSDQSFTLPHSKIKEAVESCETKCKGFAHSLVNYLASMTSPNVSSQDNCTMKSPKVTLIDFDLVVCDAIPEYNTAHHMKLASLSPITERAMAWLMKWVPPSTFTRILAFLKSFFSISIISETFGMTNKNRRSDYTHILMYLIVGAAYKYAKTMQLSIESVVDRITTWLVKNVKKWALKQLISLLSTNTFTIITDAYAEQIESVAMSSFAKVNNFLPAGMNDMAQTLLDIQSFYTDNLDVDLQISETSLKSATLNTYSTVSQRQFAHSGEYCNIDNIEVISDIWSEKDTIYYTPLEEFLSNIQKVPQNVKEELNAAMQNQ